MEYQSYEDYMRNVLGYSPMQNNVYSTYDNNLNMSDCTCNMQNQYNQQNRTNEDLNHLYPEIYKMVYPIVCKVCNENRNKQITKELLDELTDKIYIIVEPEENRSSTANVISQSKLPPLKNGDVRNPNIREPEPINQETRHRNFALRDLITILLLREFGRPIRPPMPGPGPFIPPPIFRPNTPGGPVRPPFPPPSGPPQMRNDYYMY